MRFSRLLRTVSHLKPQQIYGRVLFRLGSPAPRRGDVPPRRAVTGPWVAPVARPLSMLSATRFRFLNDLKDVVQPGDWNAAGSDELWLYNLHYFDDLNAVRAGEREAWHRALVTRWIDENPPCRGNGWEPYPSSLRIVNWIKWALRGAALDARMLESLAVQTRWLRARIEWHLLGNHLLANAKALVFAGLFFDGAEAEAWLESGFAILRQQLPEQVLADGGHFERSPMYHAIILEDLLDLWNLGRAYGRAPGMLESALPARIAAMRNWLQAMTLGDGRIAFFNDAAFGIAAEPAELEEYADRLALPRAAFDAGAVAFLRPSGYARLQAADAIVIADLAPIGPDYLPGHAHADTLSFEFSLGTERVVVNGGTSRYGTGPERAFERSTAAHSTVELDGENSSEVWGGFRVGRRARVHNVEIEPKGDAAYVAASHDGYAWRSGQPIHRRRWSLRAGQLCVSDAIEGRVASAVARFHLGPGAAVTVNDGSQAGTVVLPSGRTLMWSASLPAESTTSCWHPEFGTSIATQQIAIPILGGRLETTFRW